MLRYFFLGSIFGVLMYLCFVGAESSDMWVPDRGSGPPQGHSTSSGLLHEEREPVYSGGGSKTETGGWIQCFNTITIKHISC